MDRLRGLRLRGLALRGFCFGVELLFVFLFGFLARRCGRTLNWMVEGFGFDIHKVFVFLSKTTHPPSLRPVEKAKEI